MANIEQIREIVCNDLDPEFIKTICVTMGWEYAKLYESLADDPTLTDPIRSEEFAKRRRLCAIKALAHGAKRHGIPFNFRQLECNGQSKILVKAGRVVLIQEPILTLTDAPRAADYKRELASSHGLIRQLELDLGDQPLRIRDWSGCILAVLLHGAAGARFTREQKSLGGLMLAVPDAAYGRWVMRIDLHRVAMFGFAVPPSEPTEDAIPESIQTDQVTVTLKNRKREETGQ